MVKLRIIKKSNTNTSSVKLDNGKCYLIEKLSDGELLIADQNVLVKDKVETITIDYKNHHMTGFQFRKRLKKLQYRWFNIHTLNKILTNSKWQNI